ncbi:MAG TPA: hypothetical protein DCY88_29595 [Cyanobacteria bacterium UBA11372]|nr:hypothetical protein [Cyanobacteria bacterium UBA11372]
MQELIATVPMLKTPQEIEKAIEVYKNSDLSGFELIKLWQAIRDAALNQIFPDANNDNVPGEDSY